MVQTISVTTKEILRFIGQQLDTNTFPTVKNSGVVMPNDLAVTSEKLGQVKNYDTRKRQRRSQTGPWSRSTRWQRSTYRSRSTNRAASHICSGIQKKYESELTAVYEAYPKTKVWHQPDGLWLLTESDLLPDNCQKAVFLTVICYKFFPTVRGWGFWHNYSWIGPRHTNFPDGSICAFEPSDGTWKICDPIIKLLDLYTLWALRHLYLQNFDRWPGYQAVHHPYERILELKPNEFCGCDNSDLMYSDCCQKSDLARNRIADAINFVVTHAGGQREPPITVSRFVREQQNPPSIKELLY